MAATTAQIKRLRRLVNEPETGGYADEDLASYIERYPIVDENGQAPKVPYGSGFPVTGAIPTIPNALVDNPYWTATYDLMAAAGDIWEEKAGATVDHKDIRVGDNQASRSQVYDHYMKQARYFRARRQPRTLTARPEPLGPDVSHIINQAETD